VRGTGKIADKRPVARNQRFLFAYRPVLHAAFECERFVSCGRIRTPDKFDRPPTSRPVGAEPMIVLPDAPLQVVGMAGIIGAISAAKDIHPILHDAVPAPLDFARDERTCCPAP
jgi:hypothetical protein